MIKTTLPIIDKQIINGELKKLAMPRAVNLMQRCVELKIQSCLIERLHFNDLLLLIFSLDIQNIRQTLKNRAAAERRKNNRPPARRISQADAVNLLKGR